jgi:hypothetical protein
MHKITMFLHGDKDNNYAQAEAMGLDTEAILDFRFALLEVEFDLDVHVDGKYDILEIREGTKVFREFKA